MRILAALLLLFATQSYAAEAALNYTEASKLALAADRPLIVYKGWIAEDVDGAICCQVQTNDPLFAAYPTRCAIIGVNGDWGVTITAQEQTHKAIKAALPKKTMVGCETGKCLFEWKFPAVKSAVAFRVPQGHTHTCPSCKTTWDHESNPVGPGLQGHICPNCKTEQRTQDYTPQPVTIRQSGTSIRFSSGGCATGNCSGR